MFKDIGAKIKAVAQIFFGLIILTAVILGCVSCEDTEGLSLLAILISIPVAFLSTFLLYGFGEIIDKLTEIEANTRQQPNTDIKKTAIITKANPTIDERNKTIETLRSKNLITEEEYQQKLIINSTMDNVKLKKPITILSFIAVVCTIITFSLNLVNFDTNIPVEFNFSSIIYLIRTILSMGAALILFLFITKFHKQNNTTILYPIVSSLIALDYFLMFIQLFFAISLNYTVDTLTIVLYVIVYLPAIIAFILLTINALQGLTKKVFTIIACSLGLTFNLFGIISFCSNLKLYLQSDSYTGIFANLFLILGAMMLYISLLLFGLKNTLPCIVKPKIKDDKTLIESISSEEELLMLQEKFNQGLISTEEYTRQRTDIINKI